MINQFQVYKSLGIKEFQREKIIYQVMKNEDIVNFNFNGAYFENCDFSHSKIIESKFIEAVFINCKFDTALMASSDFLYAKFINCSLSHCLMANNTFESSIFEHSNLSHINAVQVNFVNCQLHKCAHKQIKLDSYQESHIF